MKRPHLSLLSLSNSCLSAINNSLEKEQIPKTDGLLHTVKNSLFTASNLWTVKKCIWILHSFCKDRLDMREIVCQDRRTVPFLLAVLGNNFQLGGHKPTNELQDWTRCFLVLLSENHPQILDVHTLITLNFGVVLSAINLSKGLPCIHKSTYIAMILSQSRDQLTALLEHKVQHEDEDEPSDLIDELIFILYMFAFCIETFGPEHKIHLDIMEFAFVILVRCARKEDLRERLAMDLANNLISMRSKRYLIPVFVLKRLKGEESIQRRARDLLRLLRPQLEAVEVENLASIFDQSLEI